MAQKQIIYGVRFDVHRENLKQIENDFKQLQTSLKSIQNINLPDLAKLNNTNLKNASTILANIRTQAKTVQKALAQAFNPKLNTTNITEFMRILKAEGTSMQQIYDTFRQAGPQGTAAFGSLTNSILNTNFQLKQTQTVLDKIGTTFANSLKWNLASSAINAISRSIQQAWGYTKSLDGALNDIRIVTNKSADDMAVFAARANEAAQKLGVSTTDYTKGALIYAQQGLSDKEINARNEITAKVANVTGQSTEQAAEELTAVWNGYKVNADEAEVYVDRLAAVASKTASNLEELSVGMSKVASAAASLGVGEDQLAAQLSTIIAATRQAPESVGTALRTVYARISDIKAGIDEDGTSLGMYSGKMAELGFNVLDTQGKLRNMGEVIEEIGGRWADLTKEQQINLAQVMAGQRQYSNLMALFEHFDEYNRALNIAQNATGTLQQQQDTYMEDVNAHLAVLKASVENIYDSLFSAEGMKKLIDGLTEAANKLASFIDLMGGGGNILRSLGAIGAMVFSTQIGRGINNIITNFEMAKIKAQDFATQLQVMSANIKQVPGVSDKFNNSIIENRQKLLQLGKYMTPEQQTDIQGQISEMTKLGQEYSKLRQEVELLDPAFKKLSGNKSLAEVTAGTPAERQAVIASIDQQIESYKNLAKTSEETFNKIKESFAEYKKKVDEINTNTNKSQDAKNEAINKESLALYNQVQSLRSDIQSQVTSLNNQVRSGNIIDPSAITKIKELESQARKLPAIFEGMSTDAIKKAATTYEEFGTKVKNVNAQITTSMQATKSAAEDVISKDATGQMASAEKQINQLAEVLLEKLGLIQRATKIDMFAGLAGGLATVGMAIKQFQSLGSIWSKKEQDTSIGEKLLKTVISLGMGLSMLLPALVRIKNAFTNLGIAQAFQAAMAKVSSVANRLLTGEINLLAAATELATAAQAKLKTVMLDNPFVVIATAIVAVVGAIAAITKAIEENRKATIESSRAIIDEQNAVQDKINSNRELYNSLDELNKKYSQGTISRADLRNEIDNLAEHYDIEADKVKNLKSHYKDLKETLIQLRLEEAERARSSTNTEQNAAKEALLATAKGMGKAGLTSKYLFGQDKLDLTGHTLLSQKEKNIFSQAGLDPFNTFINLKDPQDIVDKYNKIQEAIGLFGQILSPEELENNSSLKALNDIAKYLRQDAEAYIASQKEFEQVEADINAWQGEQAAKTNFYEIQKATDYVHERAKLIEQFKTELNKSQEDAEKMADVFLKDNFKQLYSQFQELASYTDQLKEKFHGLDEAALEMLGKLDSQQLGFIKQVDFSNWDELKNVIEYITTADFSNLNRILNPKIALASAKAQFNRYKDLADQYYDGKQIVIKKDEDFKKLIPEVQSYFETMEDGTHVMTGDAREFHNVVKGLEIQGFKQNAEAITESNKRLQNLRNIDIQGGALSEAAYTKGGAVDSNGQFYFNKGSQVEQYLQQQLDALTEFGHDISDIVEWKALIQDGDTTVKVVQDIANAVDDYTNQVEKLGEKQKSNNDYMYQNQLALGKTAESMKELRQYLNQGLIEYEAFNKAAMELNQKLDLEGLDRKELEEYTDYLQQMANTSAALSDQLQKNEDAANKVAKGIMKMDKGVETLAKNWQKWSEFLAQTPEESSEFLQVMDDARSAVADLLDINKDYVSGDFIKEHLAEIGEAAQGSATAIDSLRSELSEKVVAQIIVENGIPEADQADILASIDALQASIPDIEVGATINDGPFLDQIQNIIDQCGMTADQANAFLDTIGYEPTFETETKSVTRDTPVTQTVSEIDFSGGDKFTVPLIGFDVPLPRIISHTETVGTDPITETIEVPKMTSKNTPKLKSVTKKAGGSFNSGPNKKPSSGNKGKGGGGKGGGGKGKGQQPDTSQKDRKKDMEDTRDIYHDINIELEQINRRLDRAQKKQDRLYGKQLLDNLNEQTKILEEHKAALEQKHKIQEQDLKTQQETLKNLGVTFDEYNNISNYMDILGRKQAQINAETQKYNSLIDAYNASTNKDLKKALSEEAEKINKQIKEYDDEYKDLEKKIKNYDSLRVAMEDVVDQIEEETQKQIEINIKKFRMEIEIRLEMGQAERDWNKFRREVLEHTDVIKDTDFQEIFSNARQNFSDVFSYFDVHGTKGSLQMLTEQLMNTRAEIEAINETGKSAIYGDNKAQAMEDLQKDLKELMSQMEDVQSLIDDIGEAYLDTIDDVADQFDKQIEDYEYVEDLLEHDIDLLQLIYGDKNYDAMQKYYDTLTRNNLNHLDALKKQRDFWKQEWEQAVARGDVQAAKQFEQNYKETLENLNSLIEDAAQNIQDKYINAIDKIFDELDKKISNGKGTDYLSTQWDLMNKNADEYLDTINSAFAIQETERKYQKAIDENKNIKNQQTLKKLMDDQLNILRNKEKVSQYDVDRAEKLLQVEQARIALQEAQSAKTTLRLKRDSQGNYSYQYVADNNAVDDARDNLAQAQNDLYNFDKERYQSVLNDMLAAWKDFQSEYKEILEDTSLAEEERIERLALLRDEYGEYINDKTAQNAEARNNLMESAFADMAALYNTDVANYNQMSIDEQNILMGDLVPAWESGIQQMSDKVAGEGGFIPVCEQAFDSITEATKDYEEQLDNMANAAGVSLDYVTQGVDLLSEEFMRLIDNNDDLIDRMYSEVDAIQTLQDAARELVNEYQNIYNEAKTAVSEIHNFIQEEQGRAAAYMETANVAIESYHRTAQAYADAYDQMASAFENYAARVRAAASGDSSSGGSNGGNGGTGGGTGATSSPSGNKSSKSSGNNKEIIETEEGFIAGGEYYKKYYYDSGGYTGNWHSTEGRPAILHQKELVLNENDTKNFLEGTRVLREISSSLQGSLYNRIDNIGLNSLMPTNKEELEQNVHIEASFPNVNSKKEIEEAFNDLVNLAAQRAMRNN